MPSKKRRTHQIGEYGLEVEEEETIIVHTQAFATQPVATQVRFSPPFLSSQSLVNPSTLPRVSSS